MLADLALELLVAKVGDGIDKHNVQAFISVREDKALGGLLNGVSLYNREWIGEATRTLLISSAETASIFQLRGFRVVSWRILAASRTFVTRM